MQHDVQFDSDLIQRYDVTGPRYTSYPTAVQFSSQTPESYINAAQDSNKDSTKPLSIYIHIPFCEKLCFYCACNKVVTKIYDKAGPYLQHLYQEMSLQGELFDRSRPVEQLHFGGGTPTFLTDDQITGIFEHLGKNFKLLKDENREYSIEIDPRTTDAQRIKTLAGLGLNRISLGVQDVELAVQQSVNRVQPFEQTEAIVHAARNNGYNSVSFDLIYGLPHQSLDSFSNTLSTVLKLQPNRLAIYNYAHLPHLFKPQRRINESELPSAAEKLDILQKTIEFLTAEGYVYVGMDHFALPDDELVLAQEKGQLQRNFQGYSTHGHCDMIGLGVSSIGFVNGVYAQNAKTLERYYEPLSQGSLSIEKAYSCNEDDEIRRAVIQEVMCHHGLDYEKISQQFSIDYTDYFSEEMVRLEPLAADGLLVFKPGRFDVTPRGRVLLRHIAMIFDRYLGQKAGASFSKVI